MKPFVIGTRGSQLALWQARWVEKRLRNAGHPARIQIIKTAGDRATGVPLRRVGEAAGGKGVFTKEIEEALLAETIDLAVHSLKDLPTELGPRFCVAAIPERGDPRDALIGKRLDELRPGDRVGTGSLRRAAQLRHAQPGVVVEDIRGNIDTRLRKLDDGRYDAIVLAAAGLRRMGWEDRITHLLDPSVMLPAAGQGALAIEIRVADGRVREAVEPLNNPEAHATTAAERAVLDALGGGCHLPVGAYAAVVEGKLVLWAVAISPDGRAAARATVEGSLEEPAALGRRAAAELGEKGAARLMAQASA